MKKLTAFQVKKVVRSRVRDKATALLRILGPVRGERQWHAEMPSDFAKAHGQVRL